MLDFHHAMMYIYNNYISIIFYVLFRCVHSLITLEKSKSFKRNKKKSKYENLTTLLNKQFQ